MSAVPQPSEGADTDATAATGAVDGRPGRHPRGPGEQVDVLGLLSPVGDGAVVRAERDAYVAESMHINELHVTVQRRPVGWPLRVGVVPPLADCLQRRPALEAALDQLGSTGGAASGTVVLTQVLSGLGGVGKTQLAAGYAERVWAAGGVDLLVWVAAGSRDAIVSGYHAAAVAVQANDGADGEDAALAFLGWLASTGRRWLVVLDDLASPADVSGLWPPASKRGAVVVTTRRRDAALIGRGRKMVDVGLFTKAEACQYLSDKLADRLDLADDIAGLAEVLGRLPLALAQAAAYMLDRSLTCGQYRARFGDRQRKLRDVLPEAGALPDGYDKTVAVTWSLSIELADRLEPVGLARPVLLLCSLLDPNGIPETVLTAPASLALLTQMRDTGGISPVKRLLARVRPAKSSISADQARDAVACLHRLSLATQDLDNPARRVRVHALIQRATREQSTDVQLDRAVQAAADALVQAWPQIENDSVLGQALRASTTALAGARPAPLWTGKDGAHPVLFRAGLNLLETGQVTAGADYFQGLHDAATARLGPNHPDTLASRSNLAYAYRLAGRLDEAITLYSQVLADRQRVLGGDHPDTLTTRNNLAVAYGSAGRLDEAITLYSQVLADRQRVLGGDHPQTLTSRSNLAVAYELAGRLDEAIALHNQVLGDRQRVLGADHPQTLTSRNNLAGAYQLAGQLDEAITQYSQVLADEQRVLGGDHPNTLATRVNLAVAHELAGRLDEAIALYTQVGADSERVLGSDHPQTLTTHNNLAGAYRSAGRLDEAIALNIQVLADRQRVLGADHPDTLTSRNNLAYAYWSAGRLDEAITRWAQALADSERLLSPGHPLTERIRGNLEHARRDPG